MTRGATWAKPVRLMIRSKEQIFFFLGERGRGGGGGGGGEGEFHFSDGLCARERGRELPSFLLMIYGLPSVGIRRDKN